MDQLTSRRPLLFALPVLALIAHAISRPERSLPNPRVPGRGPTVAIVLFADNGTRGETIHVNKIAKSDAEWQKELSPEEFAVARKKGTERAFTGRYWNHHEAGVYKCVCCGTPLFRSDEKFDSGTGWPSFWAPAAQENVATESDDS